jgi:hypothetical protein
MQLFGFQDLRNKHAAPPDLSLAQVQRHRKVVSSQAFEARNLVTQAFAQAVREMAQPHIAPVVFVTDQEKRPRQADIVSQYPPQIGGCVQGKIMHDPDTAALPDEIELHRH